MPRTITKHEMLRRTAMANAKCAITDAMEKHSLTAMEWVNVLQESTTRMIGRGLIEEWEPCECGVRDVKCSECGESR